MARSAQKPSKQSLGKTYLHSPLVEVVFEIRFPGEPAVECQRDKYFEKIRDKFPNVLVPNVQAGQPMALLPYRFQSEDGSETVMVALNRFAFATQKYPGFYQFSRRVVPLATNFCKQHKIDRLNRTGLRYVNLIPFAREGQFIPWSRYFAIDVTLPESTTSDFVNATMTLETRAKKGIITTRIACGKVGDGNKEVFLLDFDFAKTDQLRARDLKRYLNESHDHTSKVFEGIITREYKAVMHGEVIE